MPGQQNLWGMGCWIMNIFMMICELNKISGGILFLESGEDGLDGFSFVERVEMQSRSAAGEQFVTLANAERDACF